jgi:peptidoglycan-associated lipoprotein
MKFIPIAVIFLAALLASACSSSGKPKVDNLDDPFASLSKKSPEIGKYGDGSATTEGTGGTGAADGQYGAGGNYGGGSGSPDDPNSPLSKRVIYFLYDSGEVQPQYIPIINTHASYLASHPEKSVLLEGHADERGSPEYNIGLGEQRAKSVLKLMKLQGVADSQVRIVSFGEEKPAAFGHDESAWQSNRRVEISYPGQ